MLLSELKDLLDNAVRLHKQAKGTAMRFPLAMVVALIVAAIEEYDLA